MQYDVFLDELKIFQILLDNRSKRGMMKVQIKS